MTRLRKPWVLVMVVVYVAAALAIIGCAPTAKRSKLKAFIPAAAMPNGNLLVAKYTHKRSAEIVSSFLENVIEVTPAGDIVKQFKVAGRQAVAISVSPQGAIFLLDDYKNILRKRPQASEFKRIRAFKGRWAQESKGLYPSGMTVDSQKNIYLLYGTTLNANTVLKLSPSGRFIKRWKIDGHVATGVDRVGEGMIAASPHGQIHVIVTRDGPTIFAPEHIETFTASGKKLRSWGSFAEASDLAVDPGGNVYVVNAGSDVTTIYKFNSAGRLLKSWEEFSDADDKHNYFPSNMSMTVTKQYIFVIQNGTDVHKRTLDGKLVAKWRKSG